MHGMASRKRGAGCTGRGRGPGRKACNARRDCQFSRIGPGATLYLGSLLRYGRFKLRRRCGAMFERCAQREQRVRIDVGPASVDGGAIAAPPDVDKVARNVGVRGDPIADRVGMHTRRAMALS